MRSLLLPVSIVFFLCGAEPSPTRTVRDEANILSETTKKQAQERLDAIKERYQLDVLIDTVASTPEELRTRLKSARSSQVPALMKTWAQDRAHHAELDGIYVLICMDPKDIRVVDWPKDKAYFTDRECDQLRKPFLERKVNVDKALLTLLDKLDERLQKLFIPEKLPFNFGGWVALGAIILGILLLWGVLSLLLLRMKKPEEKQQDALMPGVLGGMFGSVAGHWIYDQYLMQQAQAAEMPEAKEKCHESLQDTIREQAPS